MNAIASNVRSRDLAKELMNMGCDLAKESELGAEQVRHFWRCVMEESAKIIRHDPYEVRTEVIEAPSRPPVDEDVVMPFGKHEGTPMEDVPEGYL